MAETRQAVCHHRLLQTIAPTFGGACSRINHRRDTRLQTGIAKDRLDRIRRNISGRHPVNICAKQTFVQINGAGNMLLYIVMNIRLHIQDDHLLLFQIFIKPICGDPFYCSSAVGIVLLHGSPLIYGSTEIELKNEAVKIASLFEK